MPRQAPASASAPGRVLVSIVVSISACHAEDRGSIPRRGGALLSFSKSVLLCPKETAPKTLFTHFMTLQLSGGGAHAYRVDSRHPKTGPTGARLAQSVEHETLNLRVVGSSPTLGVRFSPLRRVAAKRGQQCDTGSNSSRALLAGDKGEQERRHQSRYLSHAKRAL